MAKIKSLHFFLFLLFAPCLCGCHIFMAHFAVYHEDITDDPNMAVISHKSLVLKQDLMLGMPDTGESVKRIERPGYAEMPTAEEYRQYGKNWVYHNKSAVQSREINGRFRDEVLGVLDKNTRLKVCEIKAKHGYENGTFIRVYVIVLNGPYEGKLFILSNCLLENSKAPDTQFLEIEE